MAQLTPVNAVETVSEVIQTKQSNGWKIVSPDITFSDVLPNQWYSEANIMKLIFIDL